MKRMLLSTFCALVMIVVCCLAFLPTSAAEVDIVDHFPTSFYNSWITSTWSQVPVDVSDYNIFEVWGHAGVEAPNDIVINGRDLYISVSVSQNTTRSIHLNSYTMKYVEGTWAVIDNSTDQIVMRWQPDLERMYIFNDGVSVVDVPIDARYTFYSRYNPNDYSTFISMEQGYTLFGQFGIVRGYDVFSAYYNGSQNGFTDGKNTGYKNGYNAGYTDGFNAGQSKDYQQGYNDAVKDIDSGEFGANFLGNTFNASIEGISQLRIVRLPSGEWITLGSVFLGIIGILLVIIFLKVFAGG